MKRVLRGLVIGTTAFLIGFGVVMIVNRMTMIYLIHEGVEALKEVQEVELSSDPTGITAVPVTVCDLKNDPAKYNHYTVMLTGFFSRGFEDSSLYDPRCRAQQWIWVELGGTRSVNVMYCCGFAPSPYRTRELEVEGIRLPLTEDLTFTKYDNWLASGKNVKATVIGTFFSGKKGVNALGSGYGGYGHMGIGSLFVVQQVLTSEVTKVKDR